MKEKVYLSGPITGLEREEYLARFEYAEQLLRADGYDVVNPCKMLPCRCPMVYRIIGYNLTLLYDIWHLMRCDRILLLPGWNVSKGACIEESVAHEFRLEDADEHQKYYDKIENFIMNWKKRYH